jgi:DNA-binding transcriptional regulator YiaG
MITSEEVKQIRINLNLTQVRFCHTFGIPLRAFQEWEYGNRAPSPTSELLLRVIEINPEVVIAASKKVMNKND